MDTASVILGVLSVFAALASAVYAGRAAYSWHLSAKVELPKEFPISVVRMTGGLGPPLAGGQVLGGMHVGTGHSEELEQLGAQLIRQSDLSAQGARYAKWSAIFAATAAILQALDLLLKGIAALLLSKAV